MKPISIQLYTVRELAKDGNHLAVLQEIADIGYTGVEGSGYGMTNKEFRKVVEDMGMVVSSGWGGLPTPETVNQFIDDISDLGTSHAVVGFWVPEFETVEAIHGLADRINAVLPKIKEAGMTLSMHNHWMEFELREGRLAVDWLLEKCPDLNLELDIYWCSNFGENKPEEMVAKYKSQANLLHVKDGSLVRGEPHVAVGSGKVDIPAALAAGDPAWHIVELDECATDMMEAVRESYRYLVGNGLSSGRKPV